MSYHHYMTTLDPILPLPGGTGLPEVRQGEGKAILLNDELSESGMTERAFFVVWEQVERRAAENYPKYVGGSMDHVAQAWLEAAVWFRRKAHPDLDFKVLSEAKVQKIRAKESAAKKIKTAAKKQAPQNGKKAAASPACPQCGDTELIETTSKKNEPIWKCFECGHKWPRTPSNTPSDPSGSPSKAGKHKDGSHTPGKSKKKLKKGKKADKKKGKG